MRQMRPASPLSRFVQKCKNNLKYKNNLNSPNAVEASVKVLILGSGAKDHALAWTMSRSHIISGLFVAPGNSGTAEIAENLDSVDITDPSEVVKLCTSLEIDYCFAGDISALQSGVVDTLQQAGISVFGPGKEATRLETDRIFAREFMEKYSIPATKAEIFNSYPEFEAYVREKKCHLVLKKYHNTSARNVFDSKNTESLLAFGKKVLQDDSLLVEQFEKGYNLSILAFIDGHNYKILPAVSDYHKARDNDAGAITNGMGAICPVPVLKEKNYTHILTDIIEPTFLGMLEENLFYKGVFFFSLLMQESGAKVTSYHVRFGDPEAQVLLPLIKSDMGNLVKSIDEGRVSYFPISLSQNSAVGVVIASEGYPETKGEERPVEILQSPTERDSLLFHGAVYRNGDGTLYTRGGRCFTVVGLGENIIKANSQAYKNLDRVKFKGAWNRNDIGNRFFEE
jgi:phosphoribosylamine--glycine ligase